MPASREQVADTFQRHVERFGYAKTTVEEVAAELGISKKTVYEYFGSKRDIYAYVVDRMAESGRVQMRTVVAELPTWGDKVEALMRFVLAGSRQHIDETSKRDWQQEYEIVGEAFTKSVGDVMLELIEGGISAGEFAFPDPVVAERLVRVMSVEYVLLVREDPALDIDEVVSQATRRFLAK